MSKPENGGGWDRAAMEGMSTSQLEELLRQGFQAPEDGDADMDRLYRAAQVLVERDPDAGGGADRAWEVFWEEYRPFARKGESLYEGGVPPPSDAASGRRRHPLSRRRWFQVAAGAALAALLLSISAAAASRI